MVNPKPEALSTQRELANRWFFRLGQYANMLHKTDSRPVKAEGPTTQQWAVLGALSREKAQGGLRIGELAKYLMVSGQNLSGLSGRIERDGHVVVAPDGRDRRSRPASGQHVWHVLAQPNILACYEDVLDDFSINDVTHTLHYLLKMVANIQRLDAEWAGSRAVAADT